MSQDNGVIRVGRKGLKKFAFGDGEPFTVDVVVAFQHWAEVDEEFRSKDRTVPLERMAEWNRTAVDFVQRLAAVPTGSPNAVALPDITAAKARDFIARLSEQYDEVAAFFQPKLRGEPDSPDSSGAELTFSAEAP